MSHDGLERMCDTLLAEKALQAAHILQVPALVSLIAACAADHVRAAAMCNVPGFHLVGSAELSRLNRSHARVRCA